VAPKRNEIIAAIIYSEKNMAKTDESRKFKKGQQVLIKNPGDLLGTIIKPRPGDHGLPEEETHYVVRISCDRYCLSASLESAEEPNDTLKPYSAEWLAEFQRWTDSAKSLVADQNDGAAITQFIESGSKLGYVVNIK
jgi:hypothetical protein